MKPLHSLLILSCCAIAAPAAAQETEWGRYGNPARIVYRDATGCIERSPDGAEPALAVRENVSGEAILSASSATWQFTQDATYDVRLVPNAYYASASRPPVAAQAHGFQDTGGRSGLTLSIPYAQLKSLGSGPGLYRDKDETSLAVFPGSGTFLHRCAVELGRVDHGSGKPGVTHPVLTNASRLLTNDDYPAAALRAEEQGFVSVRLTVSAKGLVTACEVTGSSGSAILDYTSCNLWSLRALFTPALDADGNPTEDSYRNRLHWEIPRDEPPPPK